MADVFVSYSRADKERVAPIVAAIEALGYSVWWDPAITPGQEFDTQIAAELKKSLAVLAVWTPKSVASRWVRGEAREGADRGVLIPVRFERAELPIDVRAFHTIDFDDPVAACRAQLQELQRALAALIVRQRPERAGGSSQPMPSRARRADVSICVLPFENMSGDPEQEYFSDGITEDIITDLSKVSALSVISRNSAFQFKGRHVDVPRAARELAVSHVLEGSVRKAGDRVRITAQLVDGSNNDHVWAERYDRQLEDIFAIQDEIAHAIVNALQLQLLPAEKHAIETRGTESVEAYNLYLMARQRYVTGTEGDARRAEAIIRLCARATEIDPGYARAWALLSLGHVIHQYVHGGDPEAGMAAAERALAIDPNLAEAHAMKARILSSNRRFDAASVEIEKALLLDQDSYEVHRSAGYLRFRQHRLKDAASHFEKAMALQEGDVNSANMLVSCYRALGDGSGALRAAQFMLGETERMVAQDPNNAAALSYGVTALTLIGDVARAQEWMNRALLLEPDDIKMRYNFACNAAAGLKQPSVALDLLTSVFEKSAIGVLNHAKTDPDLDSLREHPRFKAMVAAAEARLAAAGAAATTTTKA